MPRLITFGCSFTYGAGLPDCCGVGDEGPPEDAPSQLGWPSILAKKLNVELVNRGRAGASNLEILYNILSFDFKPDDVVVVMWTVHLRDMFFKKSFFSKYGFKQLGMWCTDRLAVKWMTGLTDRDMTTKSWIYMHHADLFFKEKTIQYLHYPAFYREFEDYKPNFINIDNLCKSEIQLVDKVPDGHPGLQSNLLTANVIFEILRCKN
jgi:hypothetical protein